jgi:hypothetical protein
MLAVNMLANVDSRVKELLHEMNSHTPDEVNTLALYSVAVAANANLSPENIRSLTTAILKGQLPRRKGA